MARVKKTSGVVALVGAGPGDAALLTMRAVEVLSTAAVAVVPAALVATVAAHLPAGIDLRVDGTAADAVAAARAGSPVAVILPGDPLAGLEGSALAQTVHKAKLTLEVVPGIDPAEAVPAYAGVALGRAARTVAELGEDLDAEWGALAATPGSLVLTLPAARAGKAAAALIEHGRPGDEPAVLTTGGTTTAQRSITGTLDTLGAAADAARMSGPGVLVVGTAASSRERLSWWESRPLFGMTVLVPRTRAQAGETSGLLRGYGAEPLEVPTIAVEPPRTPAPMERAIKGLVSGRYAWVAFTSANAVRAVREKLQEVGLDARAFAGVKVAAVGVSTAAALSDFGIRADLLPSGDQSSEGLLADFPEYDDLFDPLDRVFLPRADIATDTLVAGLKERGWALDDITAYRTVRAAPPAASVREAIKGGRVDAALFTSSSTVRNLVGIAGKPHERTIIACIGPQTAATAQELGLRVDVQPLEATVPALAAALAEFVVARRAAALEAGDSAELAPAAKKRAARR